MSYKYYIVERLSSFKFAFNGLKVLLKEEHNARLHVLAGLCAVIFGIVFSISALEWILVTMLIGFVFAMEILNTSIENIADYVSPDHHEKIGIIKDLGAAAVLIASFTALIVGGIIFIPKMIALMEAFNASTIN